MCTSRYLACTTALATLLLAGCSHGKLPASPTPPVEAVTANACAERQADHRRCSIAEWSSRLPSLHQSSTPH